MNHKFIQLLSRALRRRYRVVGSKAISTCVIYGIVSLFKPGVLAAAPASTAVASKVFDVREFGAKGDGRSLDTGAIQKALDECGNSGGGMVRLARGTFLSKPLFLRSKTTLQLEAGATLKATDEPADFMNPDANKGTPSSGSFFALVNGKDLVDVAINGKGTIDGSGTRWWVPAEEARRKTPGYTLRRPRLVLLTRCKNVRVDGVTLANSPSFHLVPTDCQDVIIEDVRITAPAGSPNTDGIDPSVSRRVRISRCRIDVGDDNIAIKSGKLMPGREFACEDITITDCIFLHGHGLSIGSETAGGVRNLTVQRCRFENTENGIRIKSPRGRGGKVEKLTYTDITMTNVDPAITITCYYPKIPKTDEAQLVTDETPVFRDIHIKNLTATTAKEAGVIIGLPESLVSDISLENVRIKAAGPGLTIRNATGVSFKNVDILPQKGPPLITENCSGEGLTR
jgi:polygalacturonase